MKRTARKYPPPSPSDRRRESLILVAGIAFSILTVVGGAWVVLRPFFGG
jgi:hypothetical protein